MLTHLEVEDRTAPATCDNPAHDHTRHPSRGCCCAARAGADRMGGGRRRAGREWETDRRARSACRSERPIAPPASPVAADAVRPALEKLNPDQFNLALEDLEQAIAASEAEQEKADPALRKALSDKRRVGRSRLPDHLPRVEIVIAPEDTTCPCCGGAMRVIGEDCSQRLDVIPAQYRVIVTRRPKYACRACQEAVIRRRRRHG